MLLIIAYVCYSASLAAAFISPSISSTTAQHRVSKGTLFITNNRKKHRGLLRPLTLKDDDDDEENAPADAIGGNLVSALARLDEKWELARQADGGKKIGDWNILDLKEDGETTPEIVYLLEPSSGAAPSCVIFFLGGAVLGQFPHISYSTFLERVATKMNASVVAVPYEVNLDHFSIAQRAVSRMKNAVIECEDSRGYPAELPKYAIGHSLGAKLHSIGIAATGIGEELSGVGFVSYNNFGFADTISMARSFAKEMDIGSNIPGFGAGSMPFDALFDLAGMAASAVGLEFTPSPPDMDRIVQTKFDGDVLKKTRMFQFEDDDLDSTKRFIDCFEGGTGTPSVSYLPGTHLTPVFLKLGLDDLPDEAKGIASQVTGGFKNASFGNEENLELLVDEVSDWMLGKSANDRRPARKQIAGTIDAEIEE
mmetsp:Transcript_27134/g.48974  ORF Transcript_27134/g.48974 Transcript_27134/m.48974 type:complete len:424 (-) Transcript_27134:351-1622(-)|eukprot:CAMPEP_0201869464 /NCGR_PEP_ID=MMETSP0902-20130614/2972_1 /ASSEMBLY_ACC=CAM_ASM_000551 /TAXON_ID=420261 /ORGANISM="Thalassiosira antarctica, Strain CCMP982" /LENGTH=423 /DNA_ID=CAMNT_0048394981 /DNA_START=163 /DNA_END=1434 /DNA_ORIENTATION=-